MIGLRVEPKQLAEPAAWEYGVRFLFGGAIAVITGLVAKGWGPAVSGLFLAFPAILPASLTLVKKHDGRRMAVEEARGARIGSVGLVGFALVVAVTAGRLHPALVLGIATAAWLVVDVGLWFVRFRPRRARSPRGGAGPGSSRTSPRRAAARGR